VAQIVTGEAVALELRIAQLPSRVVAAAIDFALMGAGCAVLLAIGVRLLGLGDNAATSAFVVVLVLLVFLGYPLTMETLLRGRTVGKMTMGLRVVRDDAGPITFRQALVRAVTGFALERPGVMLVGLGSALGLLVMLLSATGKRVGDMAAGTVVIQERIAPQPAFRAFLPLPLAQWAATLDLTAVDDGLALAVRQFLSRASQLGPAAAEQLGRQLLDEVLACTTPAPPLGAPGWAVLSATLAERRRREEQRLTAAGAPPPVVGTSPQSRDSWRPTRVK
jgi:uncharacterized RDD family membrane protein YckC